MNRTNQGPRNFGPFFNQAQAPVGQGGQIDWTAVGESFYLRGKFTVKLNGAVSKGATSLTVDALGYPVAKGTVLDFGEEETVVVTINGTEAQGQTSLSVDALTGPVPNGTVLDFGTGKQAKMTAAAAEGATSITVEALDTALADNDAATYQGGRKLAKVKADAVAGATTLTVEKLQFAIADDAEATSDYTGSGDKRMIPAGTVMARLTSGKLIPRRDVTGSEEACGLLASDADEKSQFDAKSGYGLVVGGTVYENLMPDADDSGNLAAGYKTELAANTLGFLFFDYEDSRVV